MSFGCLLMTSRNIEWYIESLVLRAEHVSLGPQSLVLKSRLHIGGPKVMGPAPQGGGGLNWPLDLDLGEMEVSNQGQTRHAEQVYLRAQGPNLKA